MSGDSQILARGKKKSKFKAEQFLKTSNLNKKKITALLLCPGGLYFYIWLKISHFTLFFFMVFDLPQL